MLSGIFSIFIFIIIDILLPIKTFLINQSTLQSDEAAVVIPLVLALSIPTILTSGSISAISYFITTRIKNKIEISELNRKVVKINLIILALIALISTGYYL